MEPLGILSLILTMSVWIAYSIHLNRRLSQSQNRYRQFFSDSPVALIVVNKTYRILEWNQTAETIFGWESGEAYQEPLIDLLTPGFDQPHFTAVLQKASVEGSSHSKNYNRTKQGREIFCQWHNHRLEGEEGEILCIAQDITLSQKTMDDLSKRSAALESAGDAILYTDEKGMIEFANRSFFALGLADSSRIYGTHIGTCLFKERLAFSALRSQLNTDRTWRGTITRPSTHGEKVLSVTISAIFHRSRLVSYVANLHDITRLSSHVEVLNHRVHHDPLTGAANRAAMNDRLEQALRRARRNRHKIALFFIDLNDFKLINDRHGHEAGDRLLAEVSSNLRSCLRTTDTVCRYGGDEFVIIIDEMKDDEHLQTIRHTIETAIGEPIRVNSKLTLHPKASIGVALYPDHADTAADLIKKADHVMYAHKKKKKVSVPEPALCADSHNRQNTPTAPHTPAAPNKQPERAPSTYRSPSPDEAPKEHTPAPLRSPAEQPNCRDDDYTAS